MKVLGISFSHDSTIAILNSDAMVEYAIGEERLSRIKCHTGFPFLAMNEAFFKGNFSGSDISHVAIGSHTDFNPNRAWLYHYLLTKQDVYVDLLNDEIDLENLVDDGWRSIKTEYDCKQYVEAKLKEILSSYGIVAPVLYVKHHLAHASSAYYSSGLKQALAITMDGEGDLESSTISICNASDISTIHADSNKCSIGNLYSAVTKKYGFKVARHEGKITGLAAHGKPNRSLNYFKKRIKINEFGAVEYTHIPNKKPGFFSKQFAKISKNKVYESVYDEIVSNAPRWRYADLAAGIQRLTEDLVSEYITYWIKKTGISDIVLAGGVFANVKLNARIADIEAVRKMYVYPNMGDGGLAYGAASYVINQLNPTLPPVRIKSVYYGDASSKSEIITELSKLSINQFEVSKPDNFEGVVANLLASGKIIGWYDGAMEYGPRALGHRSILATPVNKSINKWLNKRMKRTEFMPFAPSCMCEYANEIFDIKESLMWPAEFMTVTVNMKREWIKKAPAVAHIDGTARPQLVSSDTNPKFHELIRQFYLLTGLPLLINTSFNVHEEPIVRTVEEAIKALQNGTIDVLAIDGWIAQRLG